jgi:serine protein kinase
MTSPTDFLNEASRSIQSEFKARQSLLSFDEYLSIVLKLPKSQIRNSAQYLKDAIDSFGSSNVPHPRGTMKRFRIFDLHDGDGTGRVAGHEEAQNAIYGAISGFCQVGRVNKLILLHGPNGSAKSSLVESLKRGLETYSQGEAGALYTFNWIFPKEKIEKQNIGFGGIRSESSLATFAHLEAESIEVKVTSNLREHPLLILPKAQRDIFFKTLPKEISIPDNLRVGELSLKNRKIADALLATYAGDWLKVLRHVQVERFYVSRRYQTATSLVEPQMSVDAGLQQVTADRTAGNLPPTLQNLALFEPHGALVSAHRGLIEYSDLLKRPVEAFKYLLGFAENQEVSLDHVLLELDEVLIASSNEKHLEAFKQIPDFASFKGRIELVRVAYLRQWKLEQEVFDAHVNQSTLGVKVAPHSTRIAAMWAVLTRLKKPQSDRYATEVRTLVDRLTPIEKLHLYQSQEAPARLSMNEQKQLKAVVERMYEESDSFPFYEGRIGASAREMKAALLSASQSTEYGGGLHPLGVLEQLRELVADPSLYEFLQQESVGGYHAPADFIKVIEQHYLDLIDHEVREALGLVSEKQYRDLFDRYVHSVSAWNKKGTYKNPLTGNEEKPDENWMAEFEKLIMGKGEQSLAFRKSLVSSVGAWRIEHADRAVAYDEIFPDVFRRLSAHFFDERKREVKIRIDEMLAVIWSDRIDEKSWREADEVLQRLMSAHGYTAKAIGYALAFLQKHRYS